MYFNQGDEVRITGDGLLRMSKEAPEDFKTLQSLETRRGKLLMVEEGVDAASVEFAPDLVLRGPFDSLRNETPPTADQDCAGPEAMPSSAVQVDGCEEFPGYGAGFSGPVNPATKMAMERFAQSGNQNYQAQMSLNVISIFAEARHRTSAPPGIDEGEDWKAGGKSELSEDESSLYKVAMKRLSEYIDTDISVPPASVDETAPVS